ncbi:NfeD family protein [Parvularcula sp. LCG005]|uniref:NfeD family protein n=1 Tax=Parvularcula sp. LCG005 TaxID=3078805 RepID=UPI002943BAC4|nr:NfeD family protein [Parvularcula sp. LCG005]WOI52090.1 NfeD family protein [Parvularcula sp. LCG005]
MDIIGFLSDMPFWAWFVLGAVLLILEIMTGTTFLLWPAIAAGLLGLITTVQLDGQWLTQWLLFAALTVGLGIVGRPYADRWFNKTITDKPGLNDFAAGKLGKRGTVAGTFEAGQGRVRLGDTEWSARTLQSSPLTDGAAVEVVGTDGTVLIVNAI